MKVKLLYFAILRDIAGKSEDVVELPEGTRALDVWSRLRAQHRELAGYERPPMTAINESAALIEMKMETNRGRSCARNCVVLAE